jgi:hypothetical protein
MKPRRTGSTLRPAALLIWALAFRAPTAAVAAAPRRDVFSRNCLRLMESLPDT